MERWKTEKQTTAWRNIIELMGSMEFRGAAHRNMKLDCWELDFFGDNNVSLR